LTLFPGLIDDQVHFREPGMTHKGDIASESRAAMVGGITSFMEMPNTVPFTSTRGLLEDKFDSAARGAFANYSFYMGASNDNIDQIKAVDPSRVCGIKVFMGASTGNMLVDDPRVLEQIFAQAPTIVATHCEDTPIITQNERAFREKYGNDVPVHYHPVIRSTDACYKSSSLAVSLAQRLGTQLHLLHLSTEKELSLLTAAPLEGKQITAEVCVHHLYFSNEDYAAKGALIKCNPAIKTPQDRDALVQGVIDNRIDMVATDHAPHTAVEKDNHYFKSPSGLPLVQHSLQCLLEHYHEGRFSLPLIAEKAAHAPAERFCIKERGYIREGYWADGVLVDLNTPHAVSEHPIYYRCGWSPFADHTFRSTITTTIVSGHLGYHQGKIDPTPAGRRLAFDR
ncbi:MAG: dihydroorotase, partial [Deltaproteobacteria bacterium]|nr:dihydroorotase [Deltaproteobacteria bacterium]